MRHHKVVLLEDLPDRAIVAARAEPSAELSRILTAYHLKPIEIRTLPEAELVVRMQQAAGGIETGLTETRFSVPIAGMEEGAPAINLVNGLLNHAVQQRASDVHVELHHGTVAVRHRIDGRLRPVGGFAPGAFRSLSARMKVMSGLNASERRRPQDGRFSADVDGEQFDVRFSSVPTIGGESIVLRLFPRAADALAISDLGMPPEIEAAVLETIEKPSGFLLVSGPTGSGKTTTLHAALRHIDNGSRKIVTIEDPVEYYLPTVDQIQTNEAAGLTFDLLLARVLRQDTNVIMVGEIRNSETAALAVRAALTGHLVLSTVHTRRASDVPDRLINLGVDPALLHSIRPLVIAQRLVRVLCTDCRDQQFRGRTGIFEMSRIGGPGSVQAGAGGHSGPGNQQARATGHAGPGMQHARAIGHPGPGAKQVTARNTSGSPDERAPTTQKPAPADALLSDGLAKVAAGITTEEEVLWATAQ
jgi:type II secretory ATPase GspE/PulE/Tfp pilus assembly ATPase PilB-like protein